jgi:PPK2 family polyphosphate:nucleotide phosphotransferase
MDPRVGFVNELIRPLRLGDGRQVVLARDFDPGYVAPSVDRAHADELLKQGIELLAEYQDRLAAQDTCAILLVLQGMDGAGKDSTIKHMMSGVNPQGVEVHSFKQPSREELQHDFLWRHQRALPERGRVGIFNRSHYEEVLTVRVHAESLAAERLPGPAHRGDIWKRRYREINEWEHHLVDNGISVVKVFLNLSRREQAKRFLDRIDRPEKNWKFTASDVHERRYWDEYQVAFSQMLSHTSTRWAPWYVVPADHKWFARLATAAALAHELVAVDPQYPTVDPASRQEMLAAKAELLAELGQVTAAG